MASVDSRVCIFMAQSDSCVFRSCFYSNVLLLSMAVAVFSRVSAAAPLEGKNTFITCS